jgi:asparagine synthetase B (glutamine-hydrolysing)
MRGTPQHSIKQPLVNGQNVLLYNGEIYSYQDQPLAPSQHDTVLLDKLLHELSLKKPE